MKRHARIQRLEGIWLEFLVASSATTLLEEKLGDDPGFGSVEGWRRRDAIRLRENLEGTFLIRIYAEFEVNLREAWKHRFRQTSRPPMKDLLVAIATRMRVAESWMIDVDDVRAYRNALIHAGKQSVTIIPIDEARARLIRFLSRLSLDW